MPLWPFTRSPWRGYRLLRRFLVELRAIRLAIERQAAALELGYGQTKDRESLHGQVFRSYASSKEHLSDPEVKDLTGVSYVDDRMLGQMLQHEQELRALLGRDPTETELERAYRGDIE